MAETFRPPWAQFEAASGVPLAGAKLYFYQAGTTTAITVYQDNALGTPHANPVVADAAGMFAPIFIDTVTNPTYKVVLHTSADVLVQTIDNVQTDASGATASFEDDDFEIVDNVDDTKVIKFQASGITSGQTRTLTAPDASGTIALQSYVDDEIADAQPRRNLFDNPALQISTVNGNTAGTTNGYEIADGWKVYRVTSAGTITAQRVQSTTPKGAPDRGRITITVADTSLAAGEYLIATKTITGREVAHLKYGTASALQTNFRALFKFPAGTYAYSLQNAAADRSYVGLYTPASANTDETFTANIPGDTTGTWPIDTSLWTFNIVLAAGTTFQGTTGWQSGNILGTSGVTNGMGTGSAVFEFGETGWYADPESTGVAPVWELPSYRADSLYQSSVTLSTPVAATSGTSIDFTGILPGAKEIKVMFDGLSTTGTSEVIIQIGTSGGVQATGYNGSSTVLAAASVATVALSTGFMLNTNGTGTSAVRHGHVTMALANASTGLWAAEGQSGQSDITRGSTVAGAKTLSGILDRVRITTVGGTETFDAGSINIAVIY